MILPDYTQLPFSPFWLVTGYVYVAVGYVVPHTFTDYILVYTHSIPTVGYVYVLRYTFTVGSVTLRSRSRYGCGCLHLRLFYVWLIHILRCVHVVRLVTLFPRSHGYGWLDVYVVYTLRLLRYVTLLFYGSFPFGCCCVYDWRITVTFYPGSGLRTRC